MKSNNKSTKPSVNKCYLQTVRTKSNRRKVMVLAVLELSDELANLADIEILENRGDELTLKIKVGEPAKELKGLDADQILLSEPFNLRSTISKEKENELDELAVRARHGDPEAARLLILAMSSPDKD